MIPRNSIHRAKFCSVHADSDSPTHKFAVIYVRKRSGTICARSKRYLTYIKLPMRKHLLCLLIAVISTTGLQSQSLDERMIAVSNAFESKDFEFVVSTLEKDLPIYRDTFGIDDTEVIPIFELLCAYAYDSLGLPEKARDHYLSGHNLFHSAGSVDNDFNEYALNGLINYFVVRNQPEPLIRYTDRKLELYGKRYGKESIDYALKLNDAGLLLYDNFHVKFSLPYLKKSYELFNALEGPDGINTNVLANSLGLAQHLTGNIGSEPYLRSIDYFMSSDSLQAYAITFSAVAEYFMDAVGLDVIEKGVKYDVENLKDYPALLSAAIKVQLTLFADQFSCEGLELREQALHLDTSRYKGDDIFYAFEDMQLLGKHYQQCGQFEKAVKAFERYVELARQLDLEADVIAAQEKMLADAYAKNGENQKAEALLLSILSKAKRGSLLQVNANEYLAEHYFRMGAYTTSKEHYLAKMRAMEKNNVFVSEEVRGTTIGMLALVEGKLGDFQSAEKRFNQAISIMEPVADLNSVYMIKSNYAELLRLLGRYTDAISIYNDVITSGADQLELLGPVYNNLGTCQMLSGDLEGAEKSLLKGKELIEQHGGARSLLYATSLNNLGRLHHINGELLKAIDNYSNALKIQTEILDKRSTVPYVTASNLASICMQVGEVDQAIEIYSTLVTKQNEVFGRLLVEKESILASLGNCYFFKKDFDKAINLHQQALESVNEQIDLNFQFLSEREKQLFFDQNAIFYEMYFGFAQAVAASNPQVAEEAYNIILRNKGLLLRSTREMKNAILRDGGKELNQTYTEWLTEVESLSRMLVNPGLDKKTLKEQRSVCQSLEKKLVEKSSGFKRINEKVEWKDIKKQLSASEAAIEFIRYKDHHSLNTPVVYSALVLTKTMDHPLFIKLFEESELSGLIGDFSGNDVDYVNKLYGTREHHNPQLYNLIWSPILENLGAETKTIYYSPAGLLYKVSMDALYDGKSGNLGDRYQLKFRLSSRLVGHETVSYSAESDKLLIGGLNFSSKESDPEVWSYLKGAEKEVENVGRILGSQHILRGDSITESVLKKELTNAALVHIATHGFFFPNPESVEREMKENSEEIDVVFRGINRNGLTSNIVTNPNPLIRSGLALSGANHIFAEEVTDGSNDGVLTALEVISLDLSNVELVVLSACETGLGDIVDGEGVYGLQRAFKLAGAKYMIMSLWQVPDAETQKFMERFYTNLVATKDIEQAFANTQSEMKELYDPYYWAAFQLIF